MFKRKTLIAQTSKDVYLQDSEPQSGLPFSNQMHQEYRNACFMGWVAPRRSLGRQCCLPATPRLRTRDQGMMHCKQTPQFHVTARV